MPLQSTVVSATIIPLFFIYTIIAYATTDNHFLNCSVPTTCGPNNITFPFFILYYQPEYCGFPGFALSCINDNLYLNFSATVDGQFDNPVHHDYLVHNIFYTNHSLLVSIPALSDSADRPCIPHLHENISFPSTQVFRLRPNASTTLTLGYNCNIPSLLGKKDQLLEFVVGCSIGNVETGTVLAVYGDEDTESEASTLCSYLVDLQVQSSWKGSRRIKAAVRGGFYLDWTVSDCSDCENSGGKCGVNFTSLRFQCYCPDRPHLSHCSVDGDSDQSLKIGLGIGFGALGILGLVVASLIICYKSCRKLPVYSSKQNSDSLQKTEEEWGNINLEIPIFTIGELEEATKFFDSEREIGDGGFGTVYYGKLRDGREVAVKRLYEHNYRRMKQFMTEVQILTRLRHRNLVTLYGCSPRKSRELMLVYEYISNGTVADHLHGHLSKQGVLTWHVRIRIAVETAHALAYLHASDIVHRDVKTDNILLDNNFEVKVADFGMSRLFPTDVSHVSTAPQGTPGYVDPEYYLCYRLTEKSDVYSFGVVLAELLSSMPAVDITRDRHEINLSNFATSKIHRRELGQLVDVNLGFGSDPDVSRMVVSVAELAFRCLQQDKEMRPTMEEVVEELGAITSRSASKGSSEMANAYKNPLSVPTCHSFQKADLDSSPSSLIETLSSCGGNSSGGSNL